MATLINTILTILADGGATAIICILFLIVAFLFWDRLRLLKDLDKKDEKMEKIIEDYYRGNITLTEALNELRIILAEIKGKL